MKTEKEIRNTSLIDQLLVVNKPAGRLRLILLFLLIFINWSIFAQLAISHPPFFDLLFPESTNFASSIFQDILKSYLAPATLFFTLIPVFFFLYIQKIILEYLHIFFPEINIKKITSFLNACAFSTPSRNFDLTNQTSDLKYLSFHELKYLGGPAYITLASNFMPLISNLANSASLFPLKSKAADKFKFFLPFGKMLKLISLTKGTQINIDQISLKNSYEDSFQLKRIFITIQYDRSYFSDQEPSPEKVTGADTLFLNNLQPEKVEVIKSFLIDEIITFFKTELSVIDSGTALSTHENRSLKQVHNTLPSNSVSFSRYINQVGRLFFKQTFRKHTHSLYPYFYKKNALKPNGKINSLENKLLSYLEKQLKSFYHLSNIHVSHMRLEEIKINGKIRNFK